MHPEEASSCMFLSHLMSKKKKGGGHEVSTASVQLQLSPYLKGS